MTRFLAQLSDICVKNGGNHYLQQVSSREFLDQLENMLKQAVRADLLLDPRFLATLTLSMTYKWPRL